MRRIIINEHISLDGVIQGPGGPEEDRTGGFELGGWSAKYSDDLSGQTIIDAINQPYDLLLGRVTFQIWEPYWPFQSGPIADKFNSVKKYVATQTLKDSSWEGTVLLNGDTIEQVKALKASEGPDLHIWGSSDFAQSLFEKGLIDQMNLWTYPVVLGKGKKLFRETALPGNFKLTKHIAASTGLVISTYEADGKVKIGNSAEE
ncbi:dihydrofolate reductase family protein [Dyadobacter aurulentus]|uniref:dihydrofolate reductase family protein n=1 Tax=Dyadobacter sp. UC 10 TaxID=2605428 RepID=UPI0011F0F83D|nr:dihydrofolate reductase family protein [Dyadobacter sp. UC 10]KAA0992961.1 dihydrofolate reductase [Dyadobacter sp. UC 10]